MTKVEEIVSHLPMQPFNDPIPVGQLYFPDWRDYEQSMRGIFEREYYNNNGPLVTALEGQLKNFLNVKHAICVSNATHGLMIAAQAMELTGKVILPAHTFVASAQSLLWCGLTPVFCDVKKDGHHIDTTKLEALITEDVSAIMAVNLWGGAADLDALEKIASKHGMKLYFDSAQAFGCEYQGNKVGGFGDVEVFSLHATKVLSAGEGGLICTNNDELADKIRSIRPSYGTFEKVAINKVANSRMSEAQAAVALLNLKNYKDYQRNNENIYNLYSERLSCIPGISIVNPEGVTLSNFQSLVCSVDEEKFGCSRDDLLNILKHFSVLARRYFYPGVHKTVDFVQYGYELPNTDHLSCATLQLPIGAQTGKDVVMSICDIIEQTHLKSQHVDLL
ncbi:DegT/DnrJ/EryC1/StrS family aminotransferase [Paraglaciecola polaris]|uniref:DegT/DnrJ/EryC1/StrS aminotransferase n=1 Tax=Paraglaciecola polaris LMG 21857 TaxID=1129793 RepID=K7AGI5_9ALTE|nr:DegT/DnrJ/EryC1/StrS family aminotransferase [Paraglaciecola polaris]GAC34380.1 hypothetical protein GPLA_3491 [Paraglaciecola polaris LMG 21857]